jgi:hypothetical protein
MVRRMVKRVALLSVVLGVAGAPSHAHHGFAVHYDVSKQVRITGTVHEVTYRNPHSTIRVLVIDDDGDSVIWTCETQASSILKRKGITADRFALGEAIVIEGSQARRDPHGCEIGSAWLPDGSVVTMRSAEGRANIAVNATAPSMPAARGSIFGLWVRDSFTGAPVTPGFLDTITDAGRTANAGYDGSRDDPTRDCRPANPVRAMFAPGTPTVIRQEDDRIVIHHEFMDTVRTVYLAPAPEDELLTASEMGFSTGYFEGDKLVVETAHFAPGVLLTHVKNSGVLHSDQMTLTESFVVDPESGQLSYDWEAKDPLYFSASIGGQLGLSPTPLPVGRFDCQPMLSN